jgi:hypothetical protein
MEQVKFHSLARKTQRFGPKRWNLPLRQNAIDVVLQSVAAAAQYGEEFRHEGRRHDIFECMHPSPRLGFTNSPASLEESTRI